MQPTQVNPLAELKDIHLPATLDQFQLAPGWWILAMLALGLLAYGAYLAHLKWQRQRYRKAGVEALKENLAAFEQHQQPDKFLINFSTILKRVALSNYPREAVASLTGEAWVDFLDKTAGESSFSMGVGQILIDGPYQQPGDTPQGSNKLSSDIQALHRLGIKWIRGHYESKKLNALQQEAPK